MTNRGIVEEIAALPAEARREVMDFILFLRQRQNNTAVSQTVRRTPLLREPFVGIWAGRDDMTDSVRWVRGIRQREWSRRC